MSYHTTVIPWCSYSVMLSESLITHYIIYITFMYYRIIVTFIAYHLDTCMVYESFMVTCEVVRTITHGNCYVYHYWHLSGTLHHLVYLYVVGISFTHYGQVPCHVGLYEHATNVHSEHPVTHSTLSANIWWGSLIELSWKVIEHNTLCILTILLHMCRSNYS